MAGVRTAALFVVSTATISALTGYSDSLGEIINAEASYHLSGVLGAAICIAALALAVELLLALVQRALTPAAVRHTPRDELAAGATGFWSGAWGRPGRPTYTTQEDG